MNSKNTLLNIFQCIKIRTKYGNSKQKKIIDFCSMNSNDQEQYCTVLYIPTIDNSAHKIRDRMRFGARWGSRK
jgi:hypothetical protein